VSQWRLIVAVTLLFFAWKGNELDLPWPPSDGGRNVVKPEPETLEWVEDVPVEKMLPKDRLYLADFYDAMAWVVMRDKLRDQPVLATNEDFVRFHAGSLQLCIDRGDVGKTPGLGKAVDQVFVDALGDDAIPLGEDELDMLIAACNALSWRFSIHGG
jgi:hypothetical protein